MANFVLTSKHIQLAAAWTGSGTEPGARVAVGSIAGTLTDPSNFSPFVHSGGEPGSSAAMQSATTFGSLGFEEYLPGLKSGDDIVLNCYGDYTTLHGLIVTTLGGLGSFVYGDIKPTSASRGAGNPSFVFGAYIMGDTKIQGAVGDVAGRTLSLKVTGTFAELTS